MVVGLFGAKFDKNAHCGGLHVNTSTLVARGSCPGRNRL